VVILEDNKQLAKYVSLKEPLPNLKAIVIWLEDADPALTSKINVPVYTWNSFLQYGSSVSEETRLESCSHIRPGNCSTLIYTSGTTGPPKAVMISHDNVTWMIATVILNYLGRGDLGPTDKIISYLPLSHIAAQVIDIHATMFFGGCTYFAQPDALKGSLTVSMRDVKPSFFFGVPRVWEKIQEKMVQMGRANTGIKAYISAWAKATGL
jgi:long-chain-fatty-acid--CoA ligase ACSBG